MSYPSDLVRTKDWGTEIMTDSDLEGQLDLTIAWVMAALNKTTGHKHDASDNEGPKILTANINDAAGAQGDVFFSSGSAISRLAAGVTGLPLVTKAAGADPIWEALAAAGLASDSVITAKILDANVTYAKFAAAVKERIVKGWINLDGTGVIAADDSYNVSGVVDNGVGDYTVTWDTDFASADYAVTCAVALQAVIKIAAIAVGSVQLQVGARATGALTDVDPLCVIAIGNQ
jgi:hypothetical protein